MGSGHSGSPISIDAMLGFFRDSLRPNVLLSRLTPFLFIKMSDAVPDMIELRKFPSASRTPAISSLPVGRPA